MAQTKAFLRNLRRKHGLGEFARVKTAGRPSKARKRARNGRKRPAGSALMGGLI